MRAVLAAVSKKPNHERQERMALVSKPEAHKDATTQRQLFERALEDILIQWRIFWFSVVDIGIELKC